MHLRNSVLAIAVALASCGAGETASAPDRPPVGLFTTLPIYWQESADFSAMLSEEGELGWVRNVLEARYTLEPMDTLDEATLADLDRLILAQPRALSAAENVALDGWVRAGGQLLLFADPMLTRHSQFAIGDPRRPHDVVLLSPILRRWGLELGFDDDQPEGERAVMAIDTLMPVNLAGRFDAIGGDAAARCELLADGVVAQCLLEHGRIVLIADAAVLDDENTGDHADVSSPDLEGRSADELRRPALESLVAAAFRD